MLTQIVLALFAMLSTLPAMAAQPTPAAAQEAPKGPPPVSEERTIEYKIVTASERGTYIVLGRDLAKYIAPDAKIELEALPSAGSSENVFRMRYEPGVKLALVQSDVYQAFLDQAAAGNKDAGNIIRPLRVILPLYNEEIYFVVRADSPLNYIHEIKDARINAGPNGSGTALTALTLYTSMFHTPLPKATTTFLSNEEALVKYLQAYIEGVRWALDPANKAAATETLARRLELSPDIAAAVYEVVTDKQEGFAKDGRFDLEGFKNVLRLRAEYEGVAPAAPEKYLDLSYYERAMKGL